MMTTTMPAANFTPPARPDVAQMANWLGSWVLDDGRIFGFHNHSVWGLNPYRVGDFTCDHSTWASPLLPALAEALTMQWDERGRGLLHRLIKYQTHAFQSDGNYEHVGFQVGGLAGRGLIHNAIANCSLGLTMERGGELLTDQERGWIREAFSQNTVCHGRANPRGCCNQEYARIWAQLLMEQAFGELGFNDHIVTDLDRLAEAVHVAGLPDGECEATLRQSANPALVEPAEYYGLMILPLILAYKVYSQDHLLDRAGRLCRHVARSAWRDSSGHMRFHRMWYGGEGRWRRMDQPMLIAGMGDTLEGIDAYLACRPDEELQRFRDACERTYRAYQTPRGYFASATGWHSEADVAPASAWHAHDLRYLVRRFGLGAGFWQRMFDPAPAKRTSVLLGPQAVWIERANHWAIDGYMWQTLYKLRGRKDKPRFAWDHASWLNHAPPADPSLVFENLPAFVHDGHRIVLWQGNSAAVDVMNLAHVPYEGSPEEA